MRCAIVPDGGAKIIGDVAWDIDAAHHPCLRRVHRTDDKVAGIFVTGLGRRLWFDNVIMDAFFVTSARGST